MQSLIHLNRIRRREIIFLSCHHKQSVSFSSFLYLSEPTKGFFCFVYSYHPMSEPMFFLTHQSLSQDPTLFDILTAICDSSSNILPHNYPYMHQLLIALLR